MTMGVSKFDPANPVVADDYTTIPEPKNNAVGLLMGALSADNYGNQGASANIAMYDASAFSVNGGVVTIGDEIVYYGARLNNVLVACVRGAEGTQIKAHPARAVVVSNFTAGILNVVIQALLNAQLAIINFVPNERYEPGLTDGSATLALAHNPRAGSKVKLFINGVFYTDGVDFTRSGTVLTYAAAPYPPSGNQYTALYT